MRVATRSGRYGATDVGQVEQVDVVLGLHEPRELADLDVHEVRCTLPGRGTPRAGCRASGCSRSSSQVMVIGRSGLASFQSSAWLARNWPWRSTKTQSDSSVGSWATAAGAIDGAGGEDRADDRSECALRSKHVSSSSSVGLVDAAHAPLATDRDGQVWSRRAALLSATTGSKMNPVTESGRERGHERRPGARSPRLGGRWRPCVRSSKVLTAPASGPGDGVDLDVRLRAGRARGDLDLARPSSTSRLTT